MVNEFRSLRLEYCYQRGEVPLRIDKPMNHETESIEEQETAITYEEPINHPLYRVAESASKLWGMVILCVCLATALHTAPVIIVYGLISLYEAVQTFNSLTNFLLEAVQIAGVVFIAIIVFSVLTVITTGCIGFIVCPLFQAMLLTLGIEPRQLYLGGFVGGTIAYACSYTFYGSMVTSRISPSGFPLIMLTVAIILTLIATIMGQAAGIMGVRKILVESNCQVSYEVPQPRFQIKHLLWITFWVAACLTVLKTISLISPAFWLTTSIWLVIQYFLLHGVLRVMEHRETKRIEKEKRST